MVIYFGNLEAAFDIAPDPSSQDSTPEYCVDSAFPFLELSSTGCLLVSAPAVQGKTRFLTFVFRHASEFAGPLTRSIFLAASREDCSSRSALAGFLQRSLRSSGHVIDFGEILAKSELLQQNHRDMVPSLLIIDVSHCSSPSVLEWIVHSVFMLNEHFRDIAFEMDVRCFLAGSFEAPMLKWELSAKYDLPHIVLPNFTHADVRGICEGVSKLATPYERLVYDEESVNELYLQAEGDKYTTNWLNMKSVERALSRSAGGRTTVTKDDVSRVAEQIRAGELSDPRVTSVVDEWIEGRVRHNRNLYDYLMGLVEFGPSAWKPTEEVADLDSENVPPRLELFQVGVVGLAPLLNGTRLTLGQVINDPAAAREARYDIRNPMLRERIRRKLDCPTRPRHSPRKKRRGLAKLLEEEREFLARRDDFRKTYRGKFVAVHEGEVVDSDEDEFELAARIEVAYPDTEVFIHHVDEDEEVWDISTPFENGDR